MTEAVGSADGDTVADPGDGFLLDRPGETSVAVPAGHVVEFDLVGGGGAGGHRGGADGGCGTRLTGIVPAVDHDRVFVVHCGGGGRVDPTIDERLGHTGPSLGGPGGTGDPSGGIGGWGSAGRAGGGGGGGGASSLVSTDGSVKIVAGGGGGGGGGGAAPPSASADGDADGSEGATAGSIDGGNGRSRHRIAGGGGGGGGGGAPSGHGGAPGVGGGSGGAGGLGRSITVGAVAVIESSADNPDRHDDGATAGLGGEGGGLDGTTPDDTSTDARTATGGADGRAVVTWAPPGRLAARLLATRVDPVETDLDPVDAERPEHAARVIDRTGDGDGVRTLATDPVTVRLHGVASEIWERSDGNVSIRDVASRVADELEPAEAIDATVLAITTLRDLGFVRSADTLPTPKPAARDDFGFGYDLVGARYHLRADPTGRPMSADLLRAVYPEGSRPRASLDGMIDRLRERLGDDRVIWAVKHVDGHIRFEFYLFRDAAHDHPAGIAGLFTDTVEALGDLVEWNAPIGFDGNPVLVSFECSIDEEGRIHPASTIDASYNVPGRADFVINYERSADGTRLKSMSQGFDVTYERNLLLDRLGSNRGAAVGAEAAVAQQWMRRIDAMRACDRCWVSFKTNSDGVYPSRTHVDDLVGLLVEFSYPDHLREWVTDRRDRLDHLRFDLCYDYRVDGSNVVTNRTAFCGWF